MLLIPGTAIVVFYPDNHYNASATGPGRFCSDHCLIALTTKLSKKYGDWLSKPLPKYEKIRTSAEWRTGVMPPSDPKVLGENSPKTLPKRKTNKQPNSDKDETGC